MKLGIAALCALSLLAGCAATPAPSNFDQSTLPQPVQVPTGHRLALVLVGSGDVVYECQPTGPATGQYAWTFVRPEARLLDRSGKQVGRYFGPPATWDYWAGSRVTGKALASASAGDGNLPFQLVQAEPATGNHDALRGTTYIQRVNIKGGAAPAKECGWMNMRESQTVKYEADYVFYRAEQQ
jgi:hypothetical protein